MRRDAAGAARWRTFVSAVSSAPLAAGARAKLPASDPFGHVLGSARDGTAPPSEAAPSEQPAGDGVEAPAMRAVKGHRGSSRVIEGHRGSSRVIEGHQGSSRVIRGHQQPSGAITRGEASRPLPRLLGR